MARKKEPFSSLIPQGLLGEIRDLIESARQRATANVNSELTLMFWRIGRRIHIEVLAGERAEYGEHRGVREAVAEPVAHLGDGGWAPLPEHCHDIQLAIGEADSRRHRQLEL